jgi:hypothetical protein
MTKIERDALTAFGKLSTAALDAWQAGEAPWLFVVRPGGAAGDHLRSVLIEAFQGDLVVGFNQALNVAVANGLDLSRTARTRSLRLM